MEGQRGRGTEAARAGYWVNQSTATFSWQALFAAPTGVGCIFSVHRTEQTTRDRYGYFDGQKYVVLAASPCSLPLAFSLSLSLSLSL
ncbi:hypothetical protein LY76DRAFT_252062 [Colletotrichum caudatum]|nr:hypothetical protein LY76DRAFT_252062 [Colletotrichum caudatum]